MKLEIREETLGSIIEQNRESYNRMDSDTRELIEVVAGVKISEEYAMLEKGAEDMKNGETTYKVCKAWEATILKRSARRWDIQCHPYRTVLHSLQGQKIAATTAIVIKQGLRIDRKTDILPDFES